VDLGKSTWIEYLKHFSSRTFCCSANAKDTTNVIFGLLNEFSPKILKMAIDLNVVIQLRDTDLAL